MKSNISAWASFLTRGGISPFTITFRSWYFLARKGNKEKILNVLLAIMKSPINKPKFQARFAKQTRNVVKTYLERISSIRISYGVSSYSIGVLEKLFFFSLTPRRSSSMTCTQKRAYNEKI